MAMAGVLSDVKIRDRIVTFLETQGRSAPLEALGREVFRFWNPPVAFLREMLCRLFADDPHLVLREDGWVELRSEEGEDRALEESEFIVLDVETTGLHPTEDRLIEIAAFRVAGGGGRLRLQEELVTLVNPGRPLPPTIVRLTGITPEMVARAPRFEEILEELVAFLGPRVLVAHNARFDLAFLNAELQRARHKRLGHPRLCTLALSRRLFPELPNHQLPTVARYMGIEMEQWHRARADAWATARLFLRLLDPLAERGVRTLSDALCFQASRRSRR